MGMSASQARYLGLIARQNDLEYQGQQINQERTVLSQQVTDLYNMLQNMNVPTPPSTTEFTKVVYSGSDGTTEFTLGNIIPTGDTYNIDFNYTKTGHCLEQTGSAVVTPQYQQIKLGSLGKGTSADNSFTSSVISDEKTVPTYAGGKSMQAEVDDNTWIMHNVGKNPSGNNTYYVLVNGQFIGLNDDNKAQYQSADKYIFTQAKNSTDSEGNKTPNNYDTATDYYFSGKPSAGTQITSPKIEGVSRAAIASSGLYVMADGGAPVRITNANVEKYFEQDANGAWHAKPTTTVMQEDENGTVYDNPDYKITGSYKVGGNNTMSLTQAVSDEYISQESYSSYIQAIKDAFPEFANLDDADVESKVMVYFEPATSGKLTPHFVLAESLNDMVNSSGTKQALVYDYVANGTYNAAEQKEDCKLTFDTTGRISEIEYPTKYENGKPVAYKKIPLKAKTETDELAYQDAFAKYEYAKYEYDKEQQAINAKTEIIQQEDKKLELKLQRLDNERTQITTEIEAVEKVINDNIESSYKTFSG